MFAIAFPAIDPIAIAIGPFAIRWYALAYVVGLFLGWRYMIYLTRRPVAPDGTGLMSAAAVDDFFVWATLGIILGGRLGYVLFYEPAFYAAEPLQILYVWRGGMSFHGGVLGVFAAILLFARRRGLNWLSLNDVTAAAVPIGLFLGRIANFINGELFGRVTDVSWGVVFPGGGPRPRHPSQIYEAALEGLVLFAILHFLVIRGNALRSPGLVTGSFLVGYAVFRSISELFRQPDAHIGFLAGQATMGQTLSLPMLIVGLYVIWWARRRV